MDATYQQPATTATTQVDANASSITILLVEDDTILQDLYSERFSRSGFKVLQAFDGVQAIELVQQHPEVTIVLLDLMLPKMSGYDVLTHIRQNLKNTSLPIVVVSALSDIDDQAKSLQLGANEYITKGEVLPGTVIEKIHRYALSVPRSAGDGAPPLVLPPTPGSTI